MLAACRHMKSWVTPNLCSYVDLCFLPQVSIELSFPARFKMRLLGRGFHTLIKNVSFPSPTDVGSHTYTVTLSLPIISSLELMLAACSTWSLVWPQPVLLGSQLFPVYSIYVCTCIHVIRVKLSLSKDKQISSEKSDKEKQWTLAYRWIKETREYVFVYITWTLSPRGCFLVPFSGTFTIWQQVIPRI